MRFRAAAKGRWLFFLAAVCLLSALLLSPAAEASRSLPAAIAPALTAPTTPDQVIESELSDPPERLRLFEDLRLPARPLELVDASKTATGVKHLDLGLNVRQTGGLSRECGGLSFQGLWHDPLTGIAYARNRWYDARTAHWLSPDPMGAFDSPNQYAFVGWGPHMGRDPLGLATEAAFDLRIQANPNYAQEQVEMAQPMLDTLANPRVQGGLMVLGGCAEAIAGGAIALSTSATVVGVAGGLYMVSAGTDTCSTGGIMLWTGDRYNQLRERALMRAGVSETTAGLLVAGADITVGVGTGFLTRSGRLAGAGARVTPASIGARSIVQDPRLHRMWEDSMMDLFVGSGPTGRSLRQYLRVIESGGTPTAAQARKAFTSVRGSFMRRVRGAMSSGETFPGYSFDKIHHWNWYLRDWSHHALDPRHLFPVSRNTERLIHEATTIGPHRYFDPIDPRHVLQLDGSYPLAPR